MNKIKRKGIEGEDLIVRILNNQGKKIIDRNFHSRFGEIDIIVVDLKNEKLIFIEVKNVKSLIEDIFPIKQNQIRKIVSTSKYWLSKHGQYSNFLCEFWGVIILPSRELQWFELLEL